MRRNDEVDVHVIPELDRAIILCPPELEEWAVFKATKTIRNDIRETAESFIRIANKEGD